MASFKIPYGADNDGRLVSADEAAPGAALACPSCRRRLGVRGGEHMRVRKHLFHVHGQESCSEETLLHVLGKRLIVQAVQDWKAGRGGVPTISRTCSRERCRKPFEAVLPDRIADAREELRVEGGRVLDVGLVDDGGRVLAAVEVLVTHEVDDDKAVALDEASIPCAELLAIDILDSATIWKPRAERARAVVCPNCRAMDEAYAAAGVPRWIDNMAEVDGYDAFHFGVQRRGHEISFYCGYADGSAAWDVFEVVVARLASAPKDWHIVTPRLERAARAKANRTRLPEHVAFFWTVEGALQTWGGSWAEDLEGDWHGRMADYGLPSDPRRARVAELRRISGETGQMLPDRESPYWAEPYRCWRCLSEMVVYSWTGKAMYDTRVPPDPRPSTIHRRAVHESGEAHWTNVCPVCDAVQGDRHLFGYHGPLARRPQRGAPR